MNNNNDEQIVKFEFEQDTVNGKGMVSITALSRAYQESTGKRKHPQAWLVTKEAQESIAYLTSKQGFLQEEIINTVHGGNSAGTWVHPDLAEIFAQWISVEYRFAVVQLIRFAKSKQESTEPAIPQLPQTYLEALKALVISEEGKEQEKLLRLAAEEQRLLLAAQIEADSDATAHGNAVAIASNCRDIGSFGKSLATPIGRTKMFDLLRELGFIMAKPATTPYQKHIDNENMLVIQVVTELSFRKTRTDSKSLITGKGELAIVKAMKKLDKKEMVICQMEKGLEMID